MKNRNRYCVFLTLLLIFVLLPVLGNADDKRYDIPINNAVYRGPADAPITIIEFLDFQ